MAKAYKTKTKTETTERSGPFSKTTTTYTKESHSKKLAPLDPRTRTTTYTSRGADLPEGHKKGVKRKVEKTVTNNRGRTRSRLISEKRAERQMKRKDRSYKPASPFSPKALREEKRRSKLPPRDFKS